jgi:DNA-binding PadR family transcriptional regulator
LRSLLLMHARDGGKELQIAEYKPALVLEQQARLIEEGLAGGKVIKDGLHLRWIKNFHLTAAGHTWLEREGETQSALMRVTMPSKTTVRVFISHSSADIDLAEALTDLLERAFHFGRESIRCTSVTGYSLPTGARIDDQLRFEIEQSEVLIALITETSLSSTYVLFELGARWVLRRPLFPLLAKGLRSADLKEPLKALAAATCDKRDDVLRLVESVADALSLAPNKPTFYERAVVKLLATSKAYSPAKLPKNTRTISLSAHEIFALQAVFEGVTGPDIDEIIAGSLGITTARAHQALESVRRKGLVRCGLGDRGSIEYSQTEQGVAWLAANRRTDRAE